MTNAATADAPPTAPTADDRPYSPGLEGVIAGETSLSKVDGANGRLIYRGYRIGDLVEHGTYPAVANLLWTGDWDPAARLATGPIPEAVLSDAARAPDDRQADGRAADCRLRLGRDAEPALATDRRAGPRPDGVLAVRPRRVRADPRGQGAVEPDPSLDLVEGFLYQLNGRAAGAGDRPRARCLLHRRRRARLQRLDVHGPRRHLDELGHRVGGRRRRSGR